MGAKCYEIQLNVIKLFYGKWELFLTTSLQLAALLVCPQKERSLHVVFKTENAVLYILTFFESSQEFSRPPIGTLRGKSKPHMGKCGGEKRKKS